MNACCTIDSAPSGVPVWTKIEDKDGVRNVQILTRSKNLWFHEDGRTYVYYEPTHWRPVR